jgi:hypothetical protein
MKRALFIVSLPILVLATSANAADTGFEAQVRLAYGSAGGDSPVQYDTSGGAVLQGGSPSKFYGGQASPYGGGFIPELSAGYRFVPFLSAGLSGGLRKASASDPGDGSTDVARSAWMIGPYVRAYAPGLPFVSPWFQVGVAYVSDKQTFTLPTPTSAGTIPADWTLQHHGVAVPMTIGIDYNVSVLSIGPSFEYAKVFNAGGCAKASALGTSSSFCTDDSHPITKGSSYGVWSIGLHARVTL